jgi:uncharacterized membrane protein YcaP (DUF421 family)
MWFDTWSDLLRVLLVGSASYVLLITALRISGKRTLAKLNAFDLVVTVALGSTLATILLSSDVSWSEGALALGLLVALQLLVAKFSTRVPRSRTVITAQPTLLVRDGRMVDEALLAQRVTAAEVRQAIRASGVGDLALVAAVVMETDGSMSVITDRQAGGLSMLQDISGWQAGEEARHRPAAP